MIPMSVGWCAGKPADHGVPNETDVAKLQLDAYPGTTALRDFRNGSPSPSWWTTQTLAAAAAMAVRPAQFDVALSWTEVRDTPLRATLEATPEWVRRIILVGVHEMHNPDKNYTPERFAGDMAWITSEIPQAMRRRVVRAPCFIYYRSRITAPHETSDYLTPLMANNLIDAIMWDGYPSNPADVGQPGGPTNPANYEPADSFLDHAQGWTAGTGLPYGWLELNFARRANDPSGRGRAAWFGDIYRGTRADDGLIMCQFHYNAADLLHEAGTTEDDAYAALCRESEAQMIAYDTGWEDASYNVQDNFDAGRRAAYNDVVTYTSGKLGTINGIS